MKFIPPLEIASKIMTLIQEAQQELIIVSPYVNIGKWDKMKKCLRKAVERGVEITFIVRKNAVQDLSELELLNIDPILVDDLHAKVYINENSAIVTSLNLIHYSDINSIDIAYLTEDSEQRNELMDFVNRYVAIKPKVINKLKVKSLFEIVPEKVTDKILFNEYQVERLFESFSNDFSRSTFTKTKSYIFCNNLLSFADVIIDSNYVIKISKSRTDCDQILEKLEQLNYEGYHRFRIELYKKHSSFYYLTFIPLSAIELQKLIHDYTCFTTNILESNIRQILKPQVSWRF